MSTESNPFEVDLVKSSGMFLEEWYIRTNPDMSLTSENALTHFLEEGWRQNRTPSPLFNLKDYAKRHFTSSKLSKIPVNPLVDYCLRVSRGVGVNLNCPSLLENARLIGYAGSGEELHHEELVKMGKIFNSLDEQLLTSYAVIKSSGLFDQHWYKDTYLSHTDMTDPLVHYLLNGIASLHRPNPLFEPKWYCRQFADERTVSANPLLHYIQTGAESLKEPSGNFSPSVYRNYLESEKIECENAELLKHCLSTVYFDKPTGATKHPKPEYRSEYRFEDTTSAQIQTILDSGIFNEAWYKITYPVATNSKLPPIKHYVLKGRDKGLKPCQYFDPAWYKETYLYHPRDTETDPLYHYCTQGYLNGASPSPEFDAAKYRAKYLEDITDVEPLSHFYASAGTTNAIAMSRLTEIAEKIRFSGLFDESHYIEQNKHLNLSSLTPLEHYITHGERRGLSPNRFFTPEWYRSLYLQTDDASKIENSALYHYLTKGCIQGNSPSPYIDLNYYIEECEEKLELKVALTHALANLTGDRYLRDGSLNITMFEIMRTGLFMSDWYINQYEDLRDRGINALEHYAGFGWKEGRNPNPYFDGKWYISQNPHVRTKNFIPLLHYARHGWRNGRNPSPRFCVKTYKETYLQLSKNRVEPLKHFLESGKRLGNRPTALKRASDKVADEEKTAGISVKQTALLPVPPVIRRSLQHTKKTLSPSNDLFNPGELNIHWVIPDFAKGGGGHMTIFRIVYFLGLFGHRQTVWIDGSHNHKQPDSAHDDIVKFFQAVDVNVHLLESNEFAHASGDVVFATAWSTVYPVLSMSNFKQRCYFVQDFEPSFYPMGSRSVLAEQTYQEDFDCICAGPWLETTLRNKYGRWATHFPLCADKNVYYKRDYKRRGPLTRIAFYARHFTERRLVDLGMLALEELAHRGLEFQVDFFGAELDIKTAPFPAFSHGVVNPSQLADIYADADIGIVFSGTNYSLIPKEMMACGLPVVEIENECTSLVFPSETISLASPNIPAIADAVQNLLTDEQMRNKQSAAASSWVASFAWEDAAKTVESALLSRLVEKNFKANDFSKSSEIHCSVVIPTYNGGQVLKRVVEQVLSQRAPWKYELVIIDSGSSDGSTDFLSKYPQIRFIEISKSEFQHGRTRNQGVEKAKGEFVAFLTQDSIPFDEFWLYNLVNPFKRSPSIAGVFGRHVAHDNASLFTRRDLHNHFEGFLKHPLVLSKETNKILWKKNDSGWRRLLHFYSDNNSCLRKSVWKDLPYPEIAFGEDQAWADLIIKNGFSKAFAPTAVVKHSHDFSPEEQLIRSAEESRFFAEWFGYELVSPKEDIEQRIKTMNEADAEWARSNNLPEAAILAQYKLNRARFMGYLKGYSQAQNELNCSDLMDDYKDQAITTIAS